MAFVFQAPYGQGTASIGGLTVNNPLRLQNTRAPAPAPQPAGGGSSGPSAAQLAAQAAAAQAAKINALITAGTSAAVSGGQGGTAQAVGNITGLGSSLATTVGTGQNTINTARKNIGLTQINSIKQLMNTIREGLQGSGVQLGNSNALDSSAADAVARAYSRYGNVQTNSINNTAATQQSDQDVQQKDLDLTSTNGLAAIKAARDGAIGAIKAQAAQALQGLASTVAFLGGNAGQVPVQAIQDQIVQNAQNELAKVDANISHLMGGIHAASPDETARAAEAASNAGVVPSGAVPFQIASPNTAPAAQFGGPPTSLIPLTLKPKTSG